MGWGYMCTDNADEKDGRDQADVTWENRSRGRKEDVQTCLEGGRT